MIASLPNKANAADHLQRQLICAVRDKIRLKAIEQMLLDCWEALDKVPDCPSCKGTGEPTGKNKVWAEPVYWKGQIVYVCHQCKGAGKV